MALIHVYFLLWLDITFVWLPYVSLKFFFLQSHSYDICDL
jgi:hypothetical protein